MKHSRVTVSLPTELLQAVDAKLARPDETRSAVFRRLVEEALREAEEVADVARWVSAYRKQPLSDDESMADLGLEGDPSAVPWE